MTQFALNASRRTPVRILAAAILLLAFAWERLEATRLGYEVEKVFREDQQIRGRLAGMQVDLDTTLAPERLAREARTHLGLVPATPEAIRVLDRQGTMPLRYGFLAHFLPVLRGRPQAIL